ncbi:MAG: hypothetical protein O3B84_07625, partial [Chloroflexi bacterium]|nr:hypothetical protein [Chloroflexota bacterium]
LYPMVCRVTAWVRQDAFVEHCLRRESASFAVVSPPEVYGKAGDFSSTYLRTLEPFVREVAFSWSKR